MVIIIIIISVIVIPIVIRYIVNLISQKIEEERKQAELLRKQEEEEKWQEDIRTGKVNFAKAEICYDLGTVYLKEGKFDEAIKQFNFAIESNSRHKDAYCNMGIVYKEKGDIDKAIENYLKVLSLDLYDIAVNFNLGLAYMEKKQSEYAQPCFLRATASTDNHINAIAHLNLGLIEVNQQDGSLSAIDHWVKVLKYEPNNSNAIKFIDETMQKYGITRERVMRIFNDYNVRIS